MRFIRLWALALCLLVAAPLHAGTVTGAGGGGSSGGSGDASLAEQQTQTTSLGSLNTNLGATSDSAITTNTTGTIAGKLRGLIAILADIWNDSANSIRVILTDSSGNEIVMPTAGNTHYDAADASTNSTNIENSSGTIYHISLSNTTTTVYYLRLYNTSSAPTCSSATGYVESIPIPPAAAAGQVGGREIPYNIGKAFSTGISYCITASSGSTANDNAAAGVFVSILWKP